MRYGAAASQAISDKMADKPAKFAASPRNLSAGQAVLEPKVGCIAAAMAIIGSKWTALILRDLSSGPKRFCELERSSGNINPRTLSKRLDELESRAIIKKQTATQCPGHSHYALTKKGQDLVPVLKQMAAWGDKYSLKN
ncbi:MAG: winged helix-turn-helix transcriptional regulator [Candidatus Saccharimonadales bacterium]